jgi:hypothetical protein
MPWPNTWDRETVRGEIEEAAGHGLSVDDPLPDTLIAAAQEIGLQPAELRVWIFDGAPKLRSEWNAQNLRTWARRYGIGNDPEEVPAKEEPQEP